MQIYLAEVLTSSQNYVCYFDYEPSPEDALAAVFPLVGELHVFDIFPLLGNPHTAQSNSPFDVATTLIVDSLQEPTLTFEQDITVLTADGFTTIRAGTELFVTRCFSILADPPEPEGA